MDGGGRGEWRARGELREGGVIEGGVVVEDLKFTFLNMSSKSKNPLLIFSCKALSNNRSSFDTRCMATENLPRQLLIFKLTS